MAADQAQFETLLQSLMSPENEQRTQAEKTYECVPAANKVSFLLTALSNQATPTEIRSFAAVLLRKVFTSDFDEKWPTLAPDLQEGIKQQLMAAIQAEPVAAVRRKVCDATAELARDLIDEGGNMTWPEILKFMFQCASSEDPNMKESALRLISAVPGIFGSQQAHYIDVIKQMLCQCLQDANNPQVRFEAVKATTAFIVANEKDMSVINHFKDMLPFMLQIMAESIAAQKDDSLLKNLIDLAENVPKFLRSQLDSVLSLCLKIVANTQLPDMWRQLGLEAIVTLSETAPAMVRKFNSYISLIVPQIFALMIDLEEEEDWALQDEVEEEDTDSNAVASESALDRLACALGGKTMLPHIIVNVPQMLASADWRYRHAALMAISACGEGCHQQMENMLGNIMDTVLPFFKDPHPRVRYAAINAIGQLSTDFGPLLQKKFHERVVADLLLAMDDAANPRVQAHGAAALVNFSEDCPKSILTKYLDVIISKLEQVLTNKFQELLEKGTKMVLEQIVTTLASVADTAEEKFVQYYDKFMPCLKYIVENATNPELKLLRGKTIECISLIGLAVGREKFMQDGSAVMELLLKAQTQQEKLEDDDPQISYMISAWARMCKIMGKEFQQYLPLVMGPVLKSASIKPEIAVVDSDDMKNLENDPDWQFVTLGDQQSFGIRTAGLEEKATACQMLVCYARELKEGFSPYVEDVVKIMVPLLKFYFHDDVRIAAAESIPFLIESAIIRGEQFVQEMWNFICPSLLKGIEIEPETSVLPEHLRSLAKCIELLGRGCLTTENMTFLMQICEKLLKEHFDKQDERQEKRKDEDYDDDVEESLLDEDDEDVYILSKLADIFHSLFGTHKEEFLPVFDQILPLYVKLLSADRPWPDRQWALCVWDDLVEHTGPLSIKYQEYFLQNLLEYICDRNSEVRQAASYGAGIMGQFGGEPWAQACADALPRLVQIIQDPASREPENINPTENAISAVAKICKFNSSKINVNEILPHWFSWLPVWEDEDEALHIYCYLCDLIEVSNPIILGENNQNIPRIVSIIGEVIHREVIEPDEDVYKRLLNIVKQIQETVTPGTTIPTIKE